LNTVCIGKTSDDQIGIYVVVNLNENNIVIVTSGVCKWETSTVTGLAFRGENWNSTKSFMKQESFWMDE